MFSNVKTKINSSFAVKVTERSNHSFLLSTWWITFFRHLYDNRIKSTWLCKHMKNVRSSRPCISMNICTESSSSKWVSLNINISFMRCCLLNRQVGDSYRDFTIFSNPPGLIKATLFIKFWVIHETSFTLVTFCK